MTIDYAEAVAVLVSVDLLDEIDRADAKFGHQLDVPDVDQVLMQRDGGCTPKRMAEEYMIPTAGRAKFLTDLAFHRGQGTWGHIVVEEIAESIEAAVENPEALRAELLQVAATAIRWVVALDARGESGAA